MRSAILLASALAMGAVAKPVDKRYFITKVDEVIVTQTVYVQAGAQTVAIQAAPSVQAAPARHHSHHSKPSSVVVPSTAPSTPTYTRPAATSTSAYIPPAATSAVVPSSAPPASSAAPASSVNDGSHKTGTIQATFSSGPDYQAALTYHHNAVRANHNAGEVTWDDTLASNAMWSASKCSFQHQFASGVSNGQNIFTTSGNAFNVTAAVHESWYKGEFEAMEKLDLYGVADIANNMTQFGMVGHLTALVWTTTKTFGCASYNCNGKMNFPEDPTGGDPNMGMFTVCNYADEVGNMRGQFDTHVNRPISTTNLGSWLD